MGVRSGFVAACIAAGLSVMNAASARAADCAEVMSAKVAGARVTSAELTQAAPMNLSPGPGMPTALFQLPAFCRVKAVAGMSVGLEVWLPASGWNGQLLSVGSGGFGGAVGTYALADGLLRGYAVTANDTGHQGPDRAWMHNRDQVRAWGHTATHDATGPSKALVKAFYGSPARHAFFAGCSTGGAQAMEEAQFYPDDYDGIVAGSPGMSYAHLMLSFLWGLKVATAYPDSLIPPAKLQLLHHAVVQECATPPGRASGVVDDPLACRFDPRRLTCRGADGPDCLTPHQVETAIALYQGPRNPRTGAQIYPGFAFGSEAADQPDPDQSL